MHAYKIAALSAAGMVWAALPAWAGDAPKWGAHMDLEGKAGTKRNLGEADLFLPLAQDDRTLLFADLRTRMDDNDSREGNFGLGLRHMLESGWNLGGYGFFDRRRSEYYNYFNQLTVGAEALSLDWDLRANGYIPVGRRSHDEDSFNTATISGTSVIFRGGEERSLGGFDAEIGWRVPLFAAEAEQQLRVFAGGYRFADEGVPTVAGPRGRAEMVFDEVPGLWDGSRLALGAEWQHDEPRGSQGFLSARLRIPLQAERTAKALTPMERRMTDPIVRDIDVVSQAGTFGAAETATETVGGSAITVVNSATTTSAAALNNQLNTAGAGTVLLSGTFNTGGTAINMAFNQTLTGTAIVRSASGRTATVNTGAAIQGTNATWALQVNAGGTVTGLTVTNAFSGASGGSSILVADWSTGVTIANNTITVTRNGTNTASGLAFGNNTTGTVRGNTITAIGSGTGATMNALVAMATSTLTVTDNRFSASGGTTENHLANVGAGATFNSGSTGNIRGSGTCDGTANSTGSISFTDGTACR